ncbi:hypothetical protein [uncultured Sphingomonas sp.]|uniref:hypothetical protein n=1 Tax=uncultured Sphingomonas sp. TaxID=158754 RepID=UPI0025CE1125|nr:hypothetical protein [uncultured Sphingomonas sp.]
MRRLGAVVATAVLASAAQAEDVDLVGTFPAGSADVAMLRSIAVDRFVGRGGAEVGAALERALTKPGIDGLVHFIVRSDPNAADGVVQGAVSTNVSSEDFVRTDERCVERDERKKCVRKEKIRIDCTRRFVRMTAEARVIDDHDRRVLWAGAPERTKQTEWCEGDISPDSVATDVERLSGEIANDLRRTFAPTVRTYSVRFREKTKGLNPVQTAQFKGLVRQSQHDLPLACQGWSGLERQAPDHVATVFDLGVCAEAAGDLEGALARYERASQLLGPHNEAENDANRVRGLIAARDLARRRGV